MTQEAVTKIRLEAEENVSSAANNAAGSLQQFANQAVASQKSLEGLTQMSGLTVQQAQNLTKVLGLTAQQTEALAKRFSELKGSGQSSNQILKTLGKEFGVNAKQVAILNRSLEAGKKGFQGLGQGAGVARSALASLAASATTLVAGVGLIAFLKSSTDEAINFARVFNSIEAQIRATGGAAGVTGKQIDEFAKQLGRDTLTSRDEVLGASKELLKFTNITGDSFFRAIALSQDFAEVTGKKLKRTVKTIGGALSDPEKGLTRLEAEVGKLDDTLKEQIKTLTESGKVAEAQELIFAELESRFGGVGKAAAVGLGAVLDTMAEEIGDLKKLIGAELADAAVPIAEAITEIIRNFNDLPEPVRTALAGAKALLEELSETALSLGEDLGPSLQELGLTGAKAVGLLVDGFRALNGAAQRLGPLVEPILDRINTHINQSLNLIKQLGSFTSAIGASPIGQALGLDDPIEAFDAIRNANEQTFEDGQRVLDRAKGAYAAYNAEVERGAEISEETQRRLEQQKQLIEREIADNEARIEATRQYVDVTGNLSDEQQQEIAMLQRQNAALNENLDAFDQAIAKTNQATNATAENTAAIKSQADATKKARNDAKRDAKRQFDKGEKAIQKEQAKAEKDLAKELADDIETIQDTADERVTALELQRDAEVAEVKKKQDAEVAALKKQQDKEIADEQKRFTKNQAAEEKKFAKEVAEERKKLNKEFDAELSEAERQVQLTLAESSQERKELQKQFDEADKRRAKEDAARARFVDPVERRREAALEALNKREEGFKQSQEAERETFEEKLDAKRDAQEKARQALVEAHQAKIDGIQTATTRQIEAIRLATEARIEARRKAAEEARETRREAFAAAREARKQAFDDLQRKLDEASAKRIEAIKSQDKETAASKLAEANSTERAAEGAFAKQNNAARASLNQTLAQATQQFAQAVAAADSNAIAARQQAEKQFGTDQQKVEQEFQQKRAEADAERQRVEEEFKAEPTPDKPEQAPSEPTEEVEKAIAERQQSQLKVLESLTSLIESKTNKLLEDIKIGIAAAPIVKIPSFRKGGTAHAGQITQVHRDEFIVPSLDSTVLSQVESRRVVREVLQARQQAMIPVAPITHSPVVPYGVGAASVQSGEIASKLDRISQQLARLEQVGGQHQHVGSQTISILNQINPDLMENLVRQVSDRGWEQFSSAFGNASRGRRR